MSNIKVTDILNNHIEIGDNVFVISEFVKNKYSVDYNKFSAEWMGSKEPYYPDPELAERYDEMTDEEIMEDLYSEHEEYKDEDEMDFDSDYNENYATDEDLAEAEINYRNKEKTTIDSNKDVLEIGDKVKNKKDPVSVWVVKDINYQYTPKKNISEGTNEYLKLNFSIKKIQKAKQNNNQLLLVNNLQTNNNPWVLKNEDYDAYSNFLSVFRDKYYELKINNLRNELQLEDSDVTSELTLQKIDENGNVTEEKKFSPLDIVKIEGNNNRMASVVSDSIEVWFLRQESNLLNSMLSDDIKNHKFFLKKTKNAEIDYSKYPVIDITKLDIEGLRNIEGRSDLDNYIFKDYPVIDEMPVEKEDIYEKIINEVGYDNLPDFDSLLLERKEQPKVIDQIYNKMFDNIKNNIDNIKAEKEKELKNEFKNEYYNMFLKQDYLKENDQTENKNKNIINLYNKISSRLTELKNRYPEKKDEDIITSVLNIYKKKYPKHGFEKVNTYDILEYLNKENESIKDSLNGQMILDEAIEKAKTDLIKKYPDLNKKYFNKTKLNKETGEEEPVFNISDFEQYYNKKDNLIKFNRIRELLNTKYTNVDAKEFINYIRSFLDEREAAIINSIIKEADTGLTYDEIDVSDLN